MNVPVAVQQAEPSFLDACGSDISCTPAPDPVSVSWLLNSVDSVDDLAQVANLNLVRLLAAKQARRLDLRNEVRLPSSPPFPIQMLTSTWRDWRLAYAESGVGCWSAGVAAPPSVSAADAAAALASLWGCASVTDCSGSGLPAGLLPTAQISGGRLTIFPGESCLRRPNVRASLTPGPRIASSAPADLTPSCAPAVYAASGSPPPPTAAHSPPPAWPGAS